MKKRLAFAKKMSREYVRSVWTNEVCFYLDGTSFEFKTNPLSQARAPKGRVWRKKSEALLLGCTAKGRKEGTGGKTVKLMVAISYNVGVVVCEPYQTLNGEYFASFIDNYFSSMLEKANKGESRLWIQDGDPSQNSAKAQQAMKRANVNLFKIPARSPDLNPIENIFHLVKAKLSKDAIAKNIQKETYKHFQERVIATIKSIPLDTINNIIKSMPKRIDSVIRNRGNRLKY